MIADLQKAEPQREVEVQVDDGLVADVDDRLMRVVLENLFGNAWKFTARASPARVAFVAEPTDRGYAFVVRDSGAGFNMAYANKLFRPFQRLHTMKEFVGTGIGLATVHRIIDRHGGRVWAEGAVGRGAAIYFTIPPLRSGGQP